MFSHTIETQAVSYTWQLAVEKPYLVSKDANARSTSPRANAGVTRAWFEWKPLVEDSATGKLSESALAIMCKEKVCQSV